MPIRHLMSGFPETVQVESDAKADRFCVEDAARANRELPRNGEENLLSLWRGGVSGLLTAADIVEDELAQLGVVHSDFPGLLLGFFD
jgi:hypothetical protein